MKNSKLVVVALSVFALAGCGGVEGTYKLDQDEMKKIGEEEIAKLPADQQAMAKTFAEKMKFDATLELKKDNSMTMSMSMNGKDSGKTTAGTWKKEGDQIVLTADGKDVKCTKSGKKLTCSDDKKKMVFDKT